MPSPADHIRQRLNTGQRSAALDLALDIMAGDESNLCLDVWNEFFRECRLFHQACTEAVEQDAGTNLSRWHVKLKADSVLRGALTEHINERIPSKIEDMLTAARIALAARQSQGGVQPFIEAIEPLIAAIDNADGLIEALFKRANLRQSEPASSLPAEVLLVDDLFHLRSPGLGCLEESRTFLWECARRFLNVPKRSVKTATVSVVHVQGEQGCVDDLVLEVLEPGIGGVSHHFDDVFHTYPEKGFEDSVQKAFAVACGFALPNEANVDGCWRLLEHASGKPVEAADGWSASGAAAWGWWHALKDKVPDPEVIVLAQVDDLARIDRHEPPQGVGGVCAKTRAIAQATARRFDMIVVASDENQREAEEELRQLGQSGRMKVENLRVSNV